jgi:hypothetical protein
MLEAVLSSAVSTVASEIVKAFFARKKKRKDPYTGSEPIDAILEKMAGQEKAIAELKELLEKEVAQRHLKTRAEVEHEFAALVPRDAANFDRMSGAWDTIKVRLEEIRLGVDGRTAAAIARNDYRDFRSVIDHFYSKKLIKEDAYRLLIDLNSAHLSSRRVRNSVTTERASDFVAKAAQVRAML